MFVTDKSCKDETNVGGLSITEHQNYRHAVFYHWIKNMILFICAGSHMKLKMNYWTRTHRREKKNGYHGYY
jgi:hypothetical protein